MASLGKMLARPQGLDPMVQGAPPQIGGVTGGAPMDPPEGMPHLEEGGPPEAQETPGMEAAEDPQEKIKGIIARFKAGIKPTPEEIEFVKATMGEAQTEDSVGYWGGGANGLGQTGVGMPSPNGGDPSFQPLGEAPGGMREGGMSSMMPPRVPLHKRM